MSNWEATAKMFSQLFDKPKMSEKLLQKPPFRYIFDIFQETAKATGFGANLFEGEELNPNQQKEIKLQYLSKMKDLVQMMTGEELAVKPTRIIAGHEPENTNILLLATSGQDSQPFVKKVLVKYNSESLKEGKMEEPAPPAKAQDNEKEKQRQRKKQEMEQQQQKEQDEERKKMERRKQREQQKEQEKKKQDDEVQQQQLQPQPKQQPQMRPQSGIKKPPKIKDNVQTEEKQAKAGPKIIRENAKQQQQEEDLFVEDNGPKNQGIKLSNIDAKKHGKFINEALQENIEEPTENKQPQQMEEGNSKIKMSKVGQRGIKTRSKQQSQQPDMIGKDDLETLTNLIQSICQNANPLGKSLEFLNDDIESMNKERDYWRKQFEASRDKYQQEQRHLFQINLNFLIGQLRIFYSHYQIKIQ